MAIKLDVKERILLRYSLRYIVLPFALLLWSLHKMHPVFAQGGKTTVYLAFLGVFASLRQALSFFGWVHRKLTRKPKEVLQYGQWAVVTGATSGIGMAFCLELASRGMHILLISGSGASKLKHVASEIEQVGGKVQYLVRDFIHTSDAARIAEFDCKLQAKLAELSKPCEGGVGMLVNAVGMANDPPSLMHETEDYRRLLHVNIDDNLRMTQLVLPHMLERRSGAIITVSSGSCIHPTPMLSIYSATKAFGNEMARSMYHKYKRDGVDCLSITPYYFVSNIATQQTPSLMAPYPDVIVNASIEALGHKAEAFPHWGHWIGAQIAKWTPHDPARQILAVMQRTRVSHLTKLASES